ncbi:MAG: Trm112 family protein [Alphaproteobacteria bacterium]|nr:MAG: Trm112 family protein [Alphaproteobacteria bacterium]
MPDSSTPRPNLAFNEELLSLLVCPISKTSLIYDKEKQELISLAQQVAYPIRNGIPILLKEEARVLDDAPHPLLAQSDV